MKIEDELKSKFVDDYHKLVVNLHLTYSRVTESFQSSLKEFNLTGTQYNILRILRGQKQVPASIGLIKERMIERNSDVSRIIDRLLKKGIIERQPNKEDRRQKDIIINDKGLELLEKIDADSSFSTSPFSHVSLEEVQLMNDLLDKIRTKPENKD